MGFSGFRLCGLGSGDRVEGFFTGSVELRGFRV